MISAAQLHALAEELKGEPLPDDLAAALSRLRDALDARVPRTIRYGNMYPSARDEKLSCQGCDVKTARSDQLVVLPTITSEVLREGKTAVLCPHCNTIHRYIPWQLYMAGLWS